jgi:ESCRT-II complex subunit VPS36
MLNGMPHLVGSMNALGMENLENIKLSFRDGGDKIFLERLKGSMTQRKWLLQGAPPVPKPNRSNGIEGQSAGFSPSSTERVKTVGIAGLEQRGLDLRKNNELVIGSAFEDLEALMASAKEIVALAESFARMNSNNGTGSSDASDVLAQSASALGLVTTKDMLGGGGNSESLYLSELARNLAEYLTDDAQGVLRKAGGIISLVDLWAKFNRVRGGVELVSPTDFTKAARLWEKLKLPVRLRQFKSGLLVVQGSDRTDEKTRDAFFAWFNELGKSGPEREVAWDWTAYGFGVTAQETAERFGWSIGVAAEELEMLEEKGAVCREEGIEGLRFWKNLILTVDPPPEPGPAYVLWTP